VVWLPRTCGNLGFVCLDLHRLEAQARFEPGDTHGRLKKIPDAAGEVTFELLDRPTEVRAWYPGQGASEPGVPRDDQQHVCQQRGVDQAYRPHGGLAVSNVAPHRPQHPRGSHRERMHTVSSTVASMLPSGTPKAV
jgi:hypothetical protein